MFIRTQIWDEEVFEVGEKNKEPFGFLIVPENAKNMEKEFEVYHHHQLFADSGSNQGKIIEKCGFGSDSDGTETVVDRSGCDNEKTRGSNLVWEWIAATN